MATREKCPSTCADTQQAILAAMPDARDSTQVPAGRGSPGSGADQGLTDPLKGLSVQHGTLATNGLGINTDDPIDLDLAGPALPVPGSGPDIDIVRIAMMAVVVVLGGEHQSQEQFPVAAHEQYRAVLAL